MMFNDQDLDRPAREDVTTMDAMESENGCLSEKSGENYNFKDTEARNALTNGFSAAVLKYSTSLNMNTKRECQTKESMQDDSCPRCSKPGDWNHVIQFGCIERNRNELGRLRNKLEK